ncbi:anti-sigma-F factor Fin [Anoxybacillus sp. D401a]|uniref:anti-sigma-F factor Fin n=1 Tax=Anoxybacillus sp. D401a TaxID=575112 RepID=UPI003D358550
MALHYYCRHCGMKMGTLDMLDLEDEQLGFHQLTEEERLDMIQYLPSGEIYVKSICEHCQEALDQNPDLHQYEKFIQ